MSKRLTQADIKRAYQATFLAPNGDVPDAQRMVLGDLLAFTGGVQSPVQFDDSKRVDESATLVAIGRQEVWHHINQLLNLPDRTTMQVAQDAISPTGDRNV